MAAFAGSFALPAMPPVKRKRPPILLTLPHELLLSLKGGDLRWQGETIYFGPEKQTLTTVDDDFELVSLSAGGHLDNLGTATKHYRLSSQLDAASDRLRERTASLHHERDSHRVVNLGAHGVDKRGRSKSPARRQATTADPGSQESNAHVSKVKRLMAETVAPPPAKRLKINIDESAVTPSTLIATQAKGSEAGLDDTLSASGGSSSSSGATHSTGRTSTTPPAAGHGSKTAVPEVTISASSPVVATKTYGTPRERKRSSEHLSETDDPKSSGSARGHKGPRIMATTSSGTRISQPLRRSASPAASQRSISLASRGSKHSPGPELHQDRTSEDGAAARAAALASVSFSIKKRPVSVEGRTPAQSRTGTPMGSRPSTPGPVSTKKGARQPREEVWYTSSDDDAESDRRGRNAETKTLTDRRVAELATREHRSSSPTPLSRTSRSTPAHSRTPSAVLPPLVIHSAQHFAELADRFDKDLNYYESERKRLVDLRADIQVALMSGQAVVEREGGLLHIGRSDVREASRRARRRYEELSQIKAALQVWIAQHQL